MKSFDRWALRSPKLERSGHPYPALLGYGCWGLDPGQCDIPTRLFRTRQQARDARIGCCYRDAAVIRVRVDICVEK